MLANLASTQLMGVGVVQFFTAGTTLSKMKAGGWTPNLSGQTHHSNIITLQELLRGEQFAGSGTTAGSKPFGEAITENAKNNFIPLIGGAILIPVGFRLVKKITSKPRATTNRMLKMAGLKEVRV